VQRFRIQNNIDDDAFEKMNAFINFKT